MKVTKRDGRVVDYDRNKIIVAIQKANAEVDRYEQVSEEKIDAIVAGIENKHVDNLQVEDIQDMIEKLRARIRELEAELEGRAPRRALGVVPRDW